MKKYLICLMAFSCFESYACAGGWPSWDDVNPIKVVPNIVRAGGVAVGQVGGVVAGGISIVGHVAGGAVEGTAAGAMAVGNGVIHFQNEYIHFLQLRGQDLKNASPYIARLYGCEVTLCLSEYELNKKKQEARDEENQKIEAMKRQYQVAQGEVRQKYLKEYLDEVAKAKAQDEKDKEFDEVQIGYLNAIHFAALAEIENRRVTLSNGPKSPFMNPALKNLVVSAVPASIAGTDEGFLQYSQMISEYARAAKIDFIDTVTLVMQHVPSASLNQLATLSLASIDPVQKQLATTITKLEQDSAVLTNGKDSKK
jgi:hypothetical protein